MSSHTLQLDALHHSEHRKSDLTLGSASTSILGCQPTIAPGTVSDERPAWNRTLVWHMAQTPPNHRKDWTPTDNRQLRQLANENTPTRLIAYKMGRTEDAVRAHASEEGVSLKPTNQSPYNRQ